MSGREETKPFEYIEQAEQALRRVRQAETQDDINGWLLQSIACSLVAIAKMMGRRSA